MSLLRRQFFRPASFPPALLKIVRPTAKPLTVEWPAVVAKARANSSSGASRPSKHNAAAVGVIGLDDFLDIAPGGGSCLRLQLPPVGLDAKGIKFGKGARNRVVFHAAMLAADDFNQQFAADFSRRLIKGAEFLRLLCFEFSGIIGMIEGEALDGMGHRPFDQPCAHILGEFKTQRP